MVQVQQSVRCVSAYPNDKKPLKHPYPHVSAPLRSLYERALSDRRFGVAVASFVAWTKLLYTTFTLSPVSSGMGDPFSGGMYRVNEASSTLHRSWVAKLSTGFNLVG